MIDSRIKFEEKYISEEYESTTYYFIAPKEIFNNDTIDSCVWTTISVEVSNNGDRSVMYSPCIEVDDGYEDTDWRDVIIPEEEIDELIDLANITLDCM